MAWYWWTLIGLATVYVAVAIFVFLIFLINLWALDVTLDTKATKSAMWPMIKALAIWPITLYHIFWRRDDNKEEGCEK